MNTGVRDPSRKRIGDPATYLAEVGELHDAQVNALIWSVEKHELCIDIDDLYSGLVERPESVPVPARIVFERVSSLEIDVPVIGEPLWIYGLHVTGQPSGETVVIELSLSPEGRIKLRCMSLALET